MTSRALFGVALTFPLTLAVLALMAQPASALVDAGVVAVEGDMDSSPDCVVDLGAFEQLCPLSVHLGNSPGEDRVAATKHVREVRVIARPPGATPTSLALNLSDVRINTPAWRALNATWVELNDTGPSDLKGYVTFESRPMRAFTDHGWEETDNWGLFLVVHLPQPITITGQPLDSVTPVAVCWNIVCTFSNDDGYLHGDDNGIQPFPHNLLLGDDGDTHSYVRDVADAVGACLGWGLMPSAACDALAAARNTADPSLGLYENVTPTVALGFQFNRTVFEIAPPTTATRTGRLGPSPPAPASQGEGGWMSGSLGDVLAGLPTPSSLPGHADPVIRTSVTEAPPRLMAEPESVSSTARISLAPWAAGAAVAGLAVLLYHRLTRERALAQATRRRIYDLIRAEPGIRLGTIASRIDLAYPTAEQHVRILERFGLVARTGAGQKRYYAAGAHFGKDVRVHVELLATPSVRAVFDFMSRHGQDADLTAVAAALGLSPSTVSEAASKLCQAGVLERKRVQRRVRFKLAQSAATLSLFGRTGPP